MNSCAACGKTSIICTDSAPTKLIDEKLNGRLYAMTVKAWVVKIVAHKPSTNLWSSQHSSQEDISHLDHFLKVKAGRVTFGILVDVVDNLPEPIFSQNVFGNSDPVEDGDGAPPLPDVRRLRRRKQRPLFNLALNFASTLRSRLIWALPSPRFILMHIWSR